MSEHQSQHVTRIFVKSLRKPSSHHSVKDKSADLRQGNKACVEEKPRSHRAGREDEDRTSPSCKVKSREQNGGKAVLINGWMGDVDSDSGFHLLPSSLSSPAWTPEAVKFLEEQQLKWTSKMSEPVNFSATTTRNKILRKSIMEVYK